MPQAGIDPPAQNHASYEVSTLSTPNLGPKPPRLDAILYYLLAIKNKDFLQVK